MEEGNYATAISMLTDHLDRDAADFEAQKSLLHCFYLTGRYELGDQCVTAVMEETIGNDCFKNNAFLFRLLDHRYEPEELSTFKRLTNSNPFLKLNLDIVTETPHSWTSDHNPSLLSKLFFQDYRFGLIERRKKIPTMFFECGERELYSYQKPIISLGRYPCNDIRLTQDDVSRRHAVVVNYQDDAWIYDLGSRAGVCVDGERIQNKMFLNGVHTVEIGSRKIRIATKEGLLV